MCGSYVTHLGLGLVDGAREATGLGTQGYGEHKGGPQPSSTQGFPIFLRFWLKCTYYWVFWSNTGSAVVLAILATGAVVAIESHIVAPISDDQM